MAYDIELADRLRDLLAAEAGTVEKRMFGGLAFLLDGHMAVCAGSQGALMVRVDPADSEALVADPQASRMVMHGRKMAGWLLVQIDAATSDEELHRWVQHGVEFVRALPPK